MKISFLNPLFSFARSVMIASGNIYAIISTYLNESFSCFFRGESIFLKIIKYALLILIVFFIMVLIISSKFYHKVHHLT